jgi:hypothetical protein
MAPYTITLESDFSEFWRFNLHVQGEVLASGERCDMVDFVAEVASVGSDLDAPPVGYKPHDRVQLSTHEGDGLRLYIYIMPHTMPRALKISDTPDFEFCVTVEHEGKRVYHRRHVVSQWSGANIEVSL